LLSILIVVVFGLLIFSPLVSSGRGGARKVSVETEVNVDADPDHNWSILCNIANDTDTAKYNSYTTTWAGFFENNTDLKGILATPPYPPVIVGRNTTTSSFNLTVVQKFRLESNLVMDGSSEWWVRLPINNISVHAAIQVRVYQAEHSLMNISSITREGVTFSDPDDIFLIYNQTADADSPTFGNYSDSAFRFQAPDMLRYFNTTLAENYSYNFTYFKVNAPLFPNEWYFIAFTLNDLEQDTVELLVSNSDMFEDETYVTWTYYQGTQNYYPIDLDYSMLFVKGMANGLTGTPVLTTVDSNYTDYAIWTRLSYVHTIVAGDYFNLILPVVHNANVPYNLTLTVAGFAANGTNIWQHSHVFRMNNSVDKIVSTKNLTSDAGWVVHHVCFILQVSINNASGFHVFLSVPEPGIERAYTQCYYQVYESYWPHYSILERQWFIVFAHMYIDSTYWVHSNYPIVVIPIEEPESEQEIVAAYQKWKAYLLGWDGALWIVLESFGINLTWWADIVKGLVLGVVKWVVGLIHWALDLFISSGWADILRGIANFIKDVVEFVVDALEWFSYWGVRAIYSVSICIVYMVNVFGVISINSALLNLSKSGSGKDFIRAFQMGWKFILAIITLLFSMALMAISIVSAVVPF